MGRRPDGKSTYEARVAAFEPVEEILPCEKSVAVTNPLCAKSACDISLRGQNGFERSDPAAPIDPFARVSSPNLKPFYQTRKASESNDRESLLDMEV